MGILDLFKRKTSAQHDEPRGHHYAMAHYALRQVALDNPLLYLGVLASPESQRFLASLFESVCEHCTDQKVKPDFRPGDIRIHCTRVNHFPCAIVEMPEPMATAEAFITALVAFVDTSAEIPEGSKVPARYFTLEKGFSLDGRARTVMAEWTADGAHKNYGDGPNPTVRDFVGQLAAVARTND